MKVKELIDYLRTIENQELVVQIREYDGYSGVEDVGMDKDDITIEHNRIMIDRNYLR